MEQDRIVEEYRRHKLLAAYHEGLYKGRVWKGKVLLNEIEGNGIEDVLAKLKDYVDSRFRPQHPENSDRLDVSEYVQAFRSMISDFTDGHVAMLKAHYNASNQCITATQLAEAAGYANYGAANLQYGNIGKALAEELYLALPTRGDGTPIYTYALATAGDPRGEEDHWVWKLRPEVSSAIEILGLNT
jgi:hypothetical protein